MKRCYEGCGSFAKMRVNGMMTVRVVLLSCNIGHNTQHVLSCVVLS